MRIWIDEDLSPALVRTCQEHGFEATCVRDRNLLRITDWNLMTLLLEEEWTLVTNNADDFLDLAEREGVHSGLVFLPLGSAAQSSAHLARCISHVVSAAARAGETPGAYMTNRVIDVRDDGEVDDYCWPADTPSAAR